MSRVGFALVLIFALLVPACGQRAGQEAAAPAVEEAAPEWASQARGLVRNGMVPMEGVLTGGQPTDEQLARLRDAGFATVINLREPDERGTVGEAEKVEELGMEYVAIPVAGAAGLTEENARALSAALAEAERPVLVHCGSGNRVGALLALGAYWLDGADAEEALELGAAAGLTRLEGAVRERMDSAE